MYKTLTYIFIVSLCLVVISCKSTDIPDGPQAPWLSQLIKQLEQDIPANPPAKIYRYTYNNQQVYYLTARCCDTPSKLVDKDGNQLCEPDGGITGRGDSRCPNFFEKRTNETLIWEDKRES